MGRLPFRPHPDGDTPIDSDIYYKAMRMSWKTKAVIISTEIQNELNEREPDIPTIKAAVQLLKFYVDRMENDTEGDLH